VGFVDGEPSQRTSTVALMENSVQIYRNVRDIVDEIAFERAREMRKNQYTNFP
jgi:hypothetical protein